MRQESEAAALFRACFGEASGVAGVRVPGRVNLIGEHVDYHNLPVLPMAIQRGIQVEFRPRTDRTIRMVSEGYGDRSFEWTDHLEPAAAGDWENYVRAAARAVAIKWGVGRGIDAAVVSDLPPAAGLSSSSALLTGFALALLRANGIDPSFEELMEVLPEGEHFVGTRGGGMDHAAVLAGRAGCATRIEFAPVVVTPVAIPKDWAILVAHSLKSAEKSGAVKAEFNLRRSAGVAALAQLGFASFADAFARHSATELRAQAAGLGDARLSECFAHVVGETARVEAAVEAMGRHDAAGFGAVLSASHASLRDQLQVSCAALDSLVDAAMQAGALGARLTGAGFGGCAVVFCLREQRAQVADRLANGYYADRAGFDRRVHLIEAEPSAGALFA